MNPTLSNEPRELADRELQALLACSAEPVVVESYYAGWEKPWRALTDVDWHQLRREFGERMNAAVVETGKNRETAVRFGVEIIPTVLVFVGGVAVARLTGRVRVPALVGAVRLALEQQHQSESAKAELEGVATARSTPSPVRSVLRSRSNAKVDSLHAQAG
jgi:thioredoxin-like negative regulator of GroEL